MMKNKASSFLKQIITVLTSIVKAKTLALKTKTGVTKTRFIIFSLLRNKRILMDTITRKLNSLIHHDHFNQHFVGDHSKEIVVYNPNTSDMLHKEYDNDDNKYQDLNHSMFDSGDLDLEDSGGSVIDLVKNSKEEGEEFKLEDEIDHVADLFIKRFHRQILMQKQNSHRRYQEMMEMSA